MKIITDPAIQRRFRQLRADAESLYNDIGEQLYAESEPDSDFQTSPARLNRLTDFHVDLELSLGPIRRAAERAAPAMEVAP